MGQALGVDVDFVKAMHKGSVHQMVRQVLKPGQTAVDVGAAVGEIVSTMRDCVGPTGRIVAIEPRDTVIEKADQILRVACGPTGGTHRLYRAVPPTGASFFPGCVALRPCDHADLAFDEVRMNRLDDLVDEADLIKLDVQGAEAAVFEGAPRLLKTCPAWILEVWPFGLMAANRSVAEIWTRLRDAGLTIYDADGEVVTLQRIGVWLIRMQKPLTHANWLALRAHKTLEYLG